jgi:hypothetical protein
MCNTADSQLKHTTLTASYIYTLLPPEDEQRANPKHVEEGESHLLRGGFLIWGSALFHTRRC